MVSERKQRTSEEITGDMLVKRLNNSQLLQLVGNDKFQQYQSKILERLQPINGLRLSDFRKVHSSNDCRIEEIETGESIQVGGVDIDFGRWSHRIPLKKMACTGHNVVSNIFFDHYGDVREGPF